MHAGTRVERLRGPVARLERAVPWLALVAAAAGLVLVVRSQHEAIAAAEWRLGWGAVVLVVGAFSVAPLMQGLSFWLALRLLTGSTPVGDAMLVWSRSYVVRYAPPGGLAIAYRVTSRHRLHASAEQVLAAYAYEHVATPAAGAAVCLGLLALAGGLPPLVPLAVAVAFLAVAAAMRPSVAGRVAETVGRRLGLHVSPVLAGRHMAALIALNAVGWLATGAAVYLVAAGMGEGAPPFAWLVGSYAAGYLVGFVAPFAPGGLGVREGALVVILRSTFGTGVAIAISLTTRVLNAAGELLAVALVHAVCGAPAAYRLASRALASRAARPAAG